MSFNISQKILAINVGIIFSLTAIFISLSYISSDSLFSNALNGIDTQVMKDLTNPLSEHYQQHQSWNGYIENSQLWEATVNKTFFTTFFALMAKTKVNQLSPPPVSETPKVNTPPPTKDQWQFSFGTFYQRAALLDKDKNVLIESEINSKEVSYRSIKVNRKIVGWIRVGKINFDMFPLADYFFKQQLSISTWTSIAGGIIAAILSLFLSRHITTPIKRLTQGAQRISRRDFQHSIHVNTSDEFQELAQSFNSISKELNRYENQQKQWLMDISHELRTPLTILLCETTSICENITQFDISAIESLREEVNQMKRLVDDLEDLSKLDKMDLSLKNQELDLYPLIRHHSDRYRDKLAENSITLYQELPSTSLFIFGDADRMAQVFINLFENSLRYTNKPGELWIRSKILNNTCITTLEDSGPGIPEDATSRIFDRLYRTDESRNRITGGAGLGLAICKKIVLAHGGDITARNNDKGGLSIDISLPIKGNRKK